MVANQQNTITPQGVLSGRFSRGLATMRGNRPFLLLRGIMMIVAFELSMPRNNAWNNRWSGQDRCYVILKTETSQKAMRRAADLIAKGPYHYDFGDGWCACVSVREVNAVESRKLRKASVGFAGYFANTTNPTDEGTWFGRWSRHYELRLAYERAMLANVEAWCAWQQVRRLETQDLATAAAVRLAGNSRGWHEYHHPRTDRKSSLYGLLSQSDDPITGHEAAYLYDWMVRSIEMYGEILNDNQQLQRHAAGKAVANVATAEGHA